MKNATIYSILTVAFLMLFLSCSMDVNKTGALLEVAPTQIRFTQKDSLAIITVKNMGNENLHWNVQTAPDWLILTKRTGKLEAGVSDTLTIKYQRSLLDTVVEFREKIVFSSNVNSTEINVIFQSEQPNLGVSTTKLDFGLSGNSQKLVVTNKRNGFLDWKASTSVDWISISADTGHTCAGPGDTITVTIHQEMLSGPGEHQGSIQITSDANGGFGTKVSAKINVTFYYLCIDESALRDGHKLIFPLLNYAGQSISALSEFYIQPIGQKKTCHWKIASGNLPASVQFSEASYKGSNCAKFATTAEIEISTELTIKVTDGMSSSVEKTITLVTRNTEITDPEMCSIIAGGFMMGDSWGDGLNVERPAHQVNLSEFQIGKFEITNENFYKFVLAGAYQKQEYWLLTDANQGENVGWEQTTNSGWYQPRYWSNSETPWDSCSVSNQANSPVIGISWYETYAYCKWLSSITGKNYKLPTEAQWERAARGGGNGTKYPWGNTWNETAANWEDNGAKDGHLYAAPVGSFDSGKSEDGCYDMAGNVWEWCFDWYAAYTDGGSTDPAGPDEGDSRVVRGGSWKSIPRSLRTVSRTKIDPKCSNNNIGFRVTSW